MPHGKPDRRVRRTQRQLQNALIDLIKEKAYDAITIQDITDRANVGRTTFYLHYQSKEALLLEHYGDLSAHFKIAVLSREDIFGDSPQPDMTAYLELLADSRAFYRTIRAAKESDLLMRSMSARLASNLKQSLAAIFPDTDPTMPLDALTAYIAEAQLSFVDWWMTTRTPHTPVQVAMILHRLQRAAICEAYRLDNTSSK